MGFRSTFITSDLVIVWPDWFREKWEERLHFTGWFGSLASKGESKWYTDALSDLPEDLARVLREQPEPLPGQIALVTLHECDGISHLTVTRNGYTWREPVAWEIVPYPTHYYCYGCVEEPSLARRMRELCLRDLARREKP